MSLLTPGCQSSIIPKTLSFEILSSIPTVLFKGAQKMRRPSYVKVFSVTVTVLSMHGSGECVRMPTPAHPDLNSKHQAGWTQMKTLHIHLPFSRSPLSLKACEKCSVQQKVYWIFFHSIIKYTFLISSEDKKTSEQITLKVHNSRWTNFQAIEYRVQKTLTHKRKSFKNSNSKGT
jgi:hypothetical protein